MEQKKDNLFYNQHGFTLVELLVVMVIMLIIVVIFTNILIESLRGRNKVNAINQVKQNGQVVLDQLSNEIRNAEDIICVDKFHNPGGKPQDTIVINNKGIYTQFRLVPSTSTVNGYIQKENFTDDNIIGVADSALCVSTDINVDNLRQSLTDKDTQKGVSVNAVNGSEDVFEQRGNNIIIKFSASAGVGAGYAYDATVKDGGIIFSTSVQRRGDNLD